MKFLNRYIYIFKYLVKFWTSEKTFHLKHFTLGLVDISTAKFENLSLFLESLKISGRLYQNSASMRFFLRNTRINNGDIIFDDFYATTPISLMNVQVIF